MILPQQLHAQLTVLGRVFLTPPSSPPPSTSSILKNAHSSLLYVHEIGGIFHEMAAFEAANEFFFWCLKRK